LPNQRGFFNFLDMKITINGGFRDDVVLDFLGLAKLHHIVVLYFLWLEMSILSDRVGLAG